MGETHRLRERAASVRAVVPRRDPGSMRAGRRPRNPHALELSDQFSKRRLLKEICTTEAVIYLFIFIQNLFNDATLYQTT
jgi:hypothetical protein